jgi:hypothetical protein
VRQAQRHLARQLVRQRSFIDIGRGYGVGLNADLSQQGGAARAGGSQDQAGAGGCRRCI